MTKINLLCTVALFLVGYGKFYSQAAAGSQVFNYANGNSQTFTVPFGVNSITVEVWGAGGGGAGAGAQRICQHRKYNKYVDSIGHIVLCLLSDKLGIV